MVILLHEKKKKKGYNPLILPLDLLVKLFYIFPMLDALPEVIVLLKFSQ